MSAQLPPLDDDAERNLIGAALVNNDDLEEVPYIEAEHFHNIRLGKIWAAMWRLYQQHGSFDLVMLSAEIDPAKSSIGELSGLMAANLDGASPQRITVYADRVREAATRRALIDASSVIAREGHADLKPLDECLDTAMTAMEAVLDQHMTGHDDTEDARSIAGDVLVEAWDWKSNPATVRGMASGLEPVDEMLGGYEEGWLYSVAGRPGQGKSALLERLAWGFAKKHHPVLLFSLEMTAKQCFRRMGCQIAHVSATLLRQGKLSDDEFKRYTDAMEELATYPLQINARSGLTIREMQTIARRYQRRHGLAVVMVDTLNRVRVPGDKAYERMTLASHAMADWAHNSHYCIIQAVQMSRANENMQDKRPTLSALRDSGAIEEDNDVILGLYRPHYYDRENEAIRNQAELRILKFRDGDSDAAAELYWKPECLSFDRGAWISPEDQSILGMTTH